MEPNNNEKEGLVYLRSEDLLQDMRASNEHSKQTIDTENYHSMKAWFENRHGAFENQLKLVVNMAFHMGLEGITASQVRKVIASNPDAVLKWGISSPASRLSTAKKAGYLVKMKREGQREGSYVHIAHMEGGQ